MACQDRSLTACCGAEVHEAFKRRSLTNSDLVGCALLSELCVDRFQFAIRDGEAESYQPGEDAVLVESRPWHPRESVLIDEMLVEINVRWQP
jgi:hypothetical protein